MKNPYQEIESLIESVRRRRRRIRLAALLLSGAAAVLLVLLLAAAFFPALGGVARLGFRVTLLSVLFSAAALITVIGILRREGTEKTARVIEEENPRLNNALINSVQLVRAMSEGGPAGAFSPVFLQKHLEETARAIPGIELEKSVSRAGMKVPALCSVCLMAVFGLVMALFPARSRDGLEALFTEPWGRYRQVKKSAPLPLTTGDFTIRYSFPAYSGIEPQTVEHSNGDIAALKGTQVQLTTVALEPLKEASLVTSSGERLAMKISDGTKLSVELAASNAGTYFIEGEGGDGRSLAEPRSHRIVVDEDLAPRVTMLLPVADVEVAAESSLQIRFEADDDFGIREVSLVYQRDGRDERIKLRTINQDGDKQVKDDYEWVLSKMDFKPGERIPFFLEVIDNDEVAGGKTGRSDLRMLEIFSARAQHRKLLARQDELFNMMIDHLGAHLVAGVKDEKPGADPAASEKKLLEEGDALLEHVENLYVDMQDDEYADLLVTEMLDHMAARCHSLIDERKKLMSGGRPLSQTDLAMLLTLRNEYVTGLEQDVLYFDKLLKKQKVEDLLAQADDLYQAQADLADLLAEFKRTGDPALLDRLQQAMSELQEAFADMMRRMAEMKREGLPEEFINADALDKVKVSDLGSQMDELMKALTDGDMENAMAMAGNFLSRMGQWMSALEESANQFGDMMSAEAMSKLNDINDQINDLIERQKGVEDGLDEIYQKALERADATPPGEDAGLDLEEKLNEFYQALNSAQRSFFKLSPGGEAGKPRPMDRAEQRRRLEAIRPLGELKMDAAALKKSIQDNNLEQSAGQCRSILDKLGETGKGLRGFMEDNGAGAPEERQNFDQDYEHAEKLMQGMLDDIENLQKALSTRMSDGDLAELEKLSRAEDQIKKDTETTMDGYEALRGEVPSLPGEISEQLGQGAFRMNDASGEMTLGDPARAMVPAREARSHLEKARGALRESQAQMGQSLMMGSGMFSSMPSRGRPGKNGEGGLSSGEVELPDEGAHQVPEEYRKDLLKAMKEESPDGYKNLNHDYYERLVR